MTINRWTPEPNIVLHQALGKVAEEAAELAQIATRCVIQGFHEADPVTQKANRERLREEAADLRAALRWLFEVIDEPYKGESPRERRKFDGFRQWQTMLEAEDGWRPIAEADKDIAYIHDFGPELRMGNSYPIWVKDSDGRVFEALWADDGKRAYWWDIEGESPVDPIAFMPHPLARPTQPDANA